MPGQGLLSIWDYSVRAAGWLSMSGWAKDRQTSQNADPVLKSKSTFEDAKTRRITKTWLRFCCSLSLTNCRTGSPTAMTWLSSEDPGERTSCSEPAGASRELWLPDMDSAQECRRTPSLPAVSRLGEPL